MSSPVVSPIQDIARRKEMVSDIRRRARLMFEAGTPGLQIATAICVATDELVLTFVREILAEMPPEDVARIESAGAILAVGGTGRGELAPYSDVDLLFLYDRSESKEFTEFVSRLTRNCWDSGMQLGHAVRSITDCVTLGRQDPQVATSLVEVRHLWGNEALCRKLEHAFARRVIGGRKRQFIEACLEARCEGWSDHKPPSQELEPDVKNSSGGLRDLHLLRWIAFARYGVKDIDSLRLKGVLSKKDAGELKEAWEYLTRLRIDLHLHAGREQDRLTRDEQLRISKQRGFVDTPGQRGVEQFMQQFFRISSELAEIVRRFAAMERPRSLVQRATNLIAGHHAEGILYIGAEEIDVARRHLPKVCHSLETMISLYRTSALYDKPLAPRVTETIKSCVTKVPSTLTPEAARKFVEIFRCTKALGPVVRSMFSTGLLDVVIPDVTHIRNLLQFNQYHYFTVDEHTLRAIETVTTFERDEGPIGAAYNAIRNKEVLHLAVLLHDIGKGFQEDHCIVGEKIAWRIGARLNLADHQTEELALLVRKHLEMADTAFKRDLTDPSTVIRFSHGVGSPETLRKLFCLTAADITAVGPGTWTGWKAGLVADLFDRSLVILTGKRYSYLEQERIRDVKLNVAAILFPEEPPQTALPKVDRGLQGCSANYLTTTPPNRIAEDFRIMERLTDEDVEVRTAWAPETGTTEYRIISKNPVATRGCFHRLCGVLAAKRLEILSADINTTSDGVIIDSYHVVDPDFAGEPPESRYEEVAAALKSVLFGDVTVKSLFQRSTRFGANRFPRPVSGLPDRVTIDNDSSDSRTIIDVFAHDRPGLLYTLARTLFELNLSVDLAKIATYFDQVADVFFVQELDGRKVAGEQRLAQIKETIERALQEFEETYQQQFAKSS